MVNIPWTLTDFFFEFEFDPLSNSASSYFQILSTITFSSHPYIHFFSFFHMSSTLHIYYLLDSIQYQYSVSIVSPFSLFFPFLFLFSFSPFAICNCIDSYILCIFIFIQMMNFHDHDIFVSLFTYNLGAQLVSDDIQSKMPCAVNGQVDLVVHQFSSSTRDFFLYMN